MDSAEFRRLDEDEKRLMNWKRWGPYLSERQWGTVREDYSPDGSAWEFFTHDEARSRAYRWGEDGLLGITDRQCRLCFAPAFWNGKDPFLKERLFGLTGPEGNHGEDVKELYYYLDSTPTHSYMKALYKYPQQEFPYARLLEENRKRGLEAPEFELLDTGIFDGDRYFDILVEYAKEGPNDLLIRITASNRGSEGAVLHLLPTLWFRNTWIWGCEHEGCTLKPRIHAKDPLTLETRHPTLETFHLAAEPEGDGRRPVPLFTENESNTRRLWGVETYTPFVKDAFHEHVVRGSPEAVNPGAAGTKAAFHYRVDVPAGGSAVFRLRLSIAGEQTAQPFGPDFERIFEARVREADDFHAAVVPESLAPGERNVQRQAYAGLLWTKQFYHYSVHDWLRGDPGVIAPPPSRLAGRNARWRHLFNRDVISMPDKWEYPWYAAWDLAFHMIPFAAIDSRFAKEQLILMLREWYMHPSGQIPAYEFAFGDVNPPVHAWACWRIYKMTGRRGERDIDFLARAFHKLLINFTWWVNRKDPEGRNLFSGGFLGLDNIGPFNRSEPVPSGGRLEQADATAWMAFYCTTMLSIALELAGSDPVYEDVASKFFEHFVAIADAMNSFGGHGLWDEQDGFYYDQVNEGGAPVPLKVRSMVGLIPLFAVEVLEDAVIKKLPGFKKRMDWFLEHRKDLARHISCMECGGGAKGGRLLLAIPSRPRLERVLRFLFDEEEFLSDFGIRSLSRYHEQNPYRFRAGRMEHEVRYLPGESDSGLFGGNSNWRGPIWFPVNFLLVEALEKYHHFYGDALKVECPKGSGRFISLADAARDIAGRLIRLFLPDGDGQRPCHGEERRYATDPHFKDLVLFNEYFHGDNGKGLGAAHQTGWTALVAKLLQDRAKQGAPS